MPRTLPPRTFAALAAAAARLDAAGVPWLLAGSAGRALMGYRVRPADIDIEVGPDGTTAAGRALGIALRRERGAGRDSLRGATRLAGVEIDVTCDLAVEGATHLLKPDFALQRGWARPIGLGGRSIWTAPPEEGIARAIVLGDWRTLARIAGQAEGAPGTAPAIRPGYVAERLSSATERAAR